MRIKVGKKKISADGNCGIIYGSMIAFGNEVEKWIWCSKKVGWVLTGLADDCHVLRV